MHSQNNANLDLVWARMKYCVFWPAQVSTMRFFFISVQIWSEKLKQNGILGYSSSATNNRSRTGQ